MISATPTWHEDRTMELAAFALMGSLTLIVLEIVDDRRREHRKR